MKNWRTVEIESEIRRRTRNEWIERTSDSFGAHDVQETYVCECGDRRCSATISLTRAEYEVVRSDGGHFVMAVDHENPEIEVVRFENGRFTIVKKLMAAGRMSQETNPRR
jgi:hypothetical protein